MNFQSLSRGEFFWTQRALKLGLVNGLMIVERAFLGGAVTAALKITLQQRLWTFRFFTFSVNRRNVAIQNTPQSKAFATYFTVKPLFARVLPLVKVPDALRFVAFRTIMALEGPLVCMNSFVAGQMRFRGEPSLAKRTRVSPLVPGFVEAHVSAQGYLANQFLSTELASVFGVAVLSVIDLHVTIHGGHRVRSNWTFGALYCTGVHPEVFVQHNERSELHRTVTFFAFFALVRNHFGVCR